MVGDFGWEHEGTKSRVGTVKKPTQILKKIYHSEYFWDFKDDFWNSIPYMVEMFLHSFCAYE